MRAPRLLFSARPSSCCGCRSVLVRSRDDEFVTRGCLKCGKTDSVKECEVPNLACEHCDLPEEINHGISHRQAVRISMRRVWSAVATGRGVATLGGVVSILWSS